MTLEIIATNLSDAKKAEAYGADRLELSPGMLETGITPSYGLIDSVVKTVNIPFNAIIRPHSQSFIYNEDDLTVMKKDIQMVKKLGADGIVIGALTNDYLIDEEILKQLLHEAEGLDVTFHRAFDFARDQEEALECLVNYPQVKRILTAGGAQPAPQATQKIRQLIRLAENTHLEIMAGFGLREDNFKEFYNETKPNEVHFGSGVRQNESYLHPIDGSKVNNVKVMMKE
ncbi:copper homeostasis protein CutC [Lentibacillus salicampi]|uniref:PF03932 family protein CutC n=1 Tax=Lentibacillus salicampi TaxID=175306 RepID=A0A4Y9A6W8_9BACI|nr:copper homeostasis protein CutC [Lentibacillus salicampi]TFJ91423.1 copper homeostasis protein CutC [Lentibacillus salicampi]